MNSFLFCSLLLSILLIPGYALCTLTNIKGDSYKLLFGMSYSYFFFVFLLVIKLLFGMSWGLLDSLILLLIGVGSAIIIKHLLLNKKTLFSKTNPLSRYGLISVIICAISYHFLAGPYAEIPADVFSHLERLKRAIHPQSNAPFYEISLEQFSKQGTRAWYHLIALCARLTSISIESAFFYTTLISKTLFLASIYSFSLIIFSKQQYRVIISLIATLFIAIHLGVNIFSYLRYYSFAPSMLAYVVYLASIIAFFKLIKSSSFSNFLILGLSILAFVFTTFTVHHQEALFIIVMLFMISIVISSQFILNNSLVTNPPSIAAKSNTLIIARNTPHIISILGLTGFCLAYSYAQENLYLSPNISWRLWEFQVHTFKVQILNLKFQFIQTLTLWGVMVLFVSIFSAKHLKDNTFLIAGLLSPFLTVLNPFFVDFFLRISSSPNLYRVLYIVPVHFTAALLLIKFAETAYLKKTLLAKGLFFIYASLSIALLLPISNTYSNLHYSRFPTLVKTSPNLSPNHFKDLIAELNNISEKYRILTDPMTGYAVVALTKHQGITKNRFSPSKTHHKVFYYESYNEQSLQAHKGKLIIINHRKHQTSKVGKLSGHWPENIMNVKPFYSPALIAHLNENPKLFKLLWESEHKDIRIYKIIN